MTADSTVQWRPGRQVVLWNSDGTRRLVVIAGRQGAGQLTIVFQGNMAPRRRASRSTATMFPITSISARCSWGRQRAHLSRVRRRAAKLPEWSNVGSGKAMSS